MKPVLRRLTLATAVALLPTVALAQAPAKAMNGMLASNDGMTLYTFDKDAGGKSACNGACPGVWPPLKASADAKDAGDWTVVTRDDGSKQWAFKGKPLYTYSKDGKAGDKNGDGIGGAWHVVKQ
jgi:predicted lipoprotein with Yx(FWY)xxD motif